MGVSVGGMVWEEMRRVDGEGCRVITPEMFTCCCAAYISYVLMTLFCWFPLTFNRAGRWSADLPFGFRRGGDGRSGLRFVLDHGGSEAVRGAAGFVGAALESDRGFLPLTINRTGMLCGFCCLRWAPEMRLGGSSASAGGVACGMVWGSCIG